MNTIAALRGEKVKRDNGDDDNECNVCLCEMEQANMAITHCGHLFHKECLESYFDSVAGIRSSPMCPACRHPLTREPPTYDLIADILLQVTSVSSEKKSDGRLGSKMRAILNELEYIWSERPNAKIIMFCQWQTILYHLSDVLNKKGRKHFLLDGAIRRRQEMLRQFEEENDTKILLLSLENSPSGMNLVCSSDIFFVHPMYADSKMKAISYEMQALGRVQRRGQKNNVFVYRFVTVGTIEEELSERHQTHLEGVSNGSIDMDKISRDIIKGKNAGEGGESEGGKEEVE